ncbi:MAG: branched-chain amino acid ABC transporter permease [Rhodospirillales bacterium]|nr:branched-chain amino acid ABC transporter permease [Rhodospirillales bacterium]MCY3856034.1 branched-chain amino acid ABC transporter permease [Rhodospirillales bacterium]MCY4004919.1 branched-chain amino acid ABC transporter permease [Rhodospirillales bacterium]MDE0371734.1 branched-chain amino acid ABC transporter permease [Rhodospirillales bacterium]MXX22726.1 branched-chain amino acid ABC transporter permease [Rhodospirillales bacterium]
MMALAAIVVDSLVYASWLFIVSIGLTLIFGVMNVLNVAHGSLYALGAYTAAWGVGMYVGGAPDAGFVLLAIMLVAAIVVGVLVGILIERGVLRWVYGRDEIVIVLATYAVFLVLEDVMKLIFGAESYIAFQPRFLFGTISVAGIPYVGYDLLLVPLVALIGVGIWAAIHRTRPGKLLIAVIHDREIASALGINVARFFTVTFLCGAVLGALGGALSAPLISVVPGIGVELIVLAFAVVVIGGLGSVEGAAIGALLVGLGRTAAVFFRPELELFVVFVVMTVVLAVRPEGLFGKPQTRRI